MKRLCAILVMQLAFVTGRLAAQDSVAILPAFTIHGYLKDLQSLSFNNLMDSITSGNLLHNRINMKWKPGKAFTAAMELRSRLFWGEQVAADPQFARNILNTGETIRLSIDWWRRSNLLLQTNVERLWMEYRRPEWNVRVGRQRINWGQTITWNPNDLFNTYNFLDFDYEERPGADALRAQYFFSSTNYAELVFNPSKDGSRHIAAAKYFINTHGYDIQLIGGWYQTRFTIGAGWAGNIGNAAYKGEIQYFFRGSDSSHVNVTMEASYMTAGGLLLSTAALFNSRGLNGPVNDWNKVNLQLSAVRLMPGKWSFIISGVKELSPLFSSNLSLVYEPGLNLLIVYPSLRYNLAANLDADLVWQSFFADLDGRFRGVLHTAFIRLKFSF